MQPRKDKGQRIKERDLVGVGQLRRVERFKISDPACDVRVEGHVEIVREARQLTSATKGESHISKTNPPS